MSIPLTTPLRATAGPLNNIDNHAVTDPLYGIDGLRSVAGQTERDSVAAQRRRHGMVAFTRSDGGYWPINSDLTTWSEWLGGTPGSAWYDGAGVSGVGAENTGRDTGRRPIKIPPPARFLTGQGHDPGPEDN
jgi:hypothetical protein